MTALRWLSGLLSFVAGTGCWRQIPKPHPAEANVAYGRHESNVLDFWKAASASRTPLVVFFHGGGFRNGDKEDLDSGDLKRLLQGGVSVAAVNYRHLPMNPLPAAHHDARRAIQFLRSKADAWNLDKGRVGAFGVSAGAQLTMYLAFHPDMAQPASEDPVERESTRLAAVASINGQTTMDFDWWIRHIPGYQRYHLPYREFYGDVDQVTVREIIADISALSLLSADDPPIHMSYRMAPDSAPPSDPESAENWKLHHVNFGVELKRKMDVLKVEADLKYPGSKSGYESIADFFLAKLVRGTVVR